MYTLHTTEDLYLGSYKTLKEAQEDQKRTLQDWELDSVVREVDVEGFAKDYRALTNNNKDNIDAFEHLGQALCGGMGVVYVDIPPYLTKSGEYESLPLSSYIK